MFFLAAPLSMAVPPPNRYEIPQAPNKLQPLANPRKLSEISGVTVSYYDVVGDTIPKLHDWLAKHGPRDAGTHRVLPATSSWQIGSAVKFTKSGGQCTLIDATVKFTANATLPRLAAGQKIDPPVLANWNAYVAVLEDRQAAQLGFVHDRLAEVENSIRRSSCADWQRAADAAITRLSEEQARAFQSDPKAQPKLVEPKKEENNPLRTL